MNSPLYQRPRTRACNYFSPLQENDEEEGNLEYSPPRCPNITLDHNQTLLKALKASNYNYHWAPLYLTNDLKPTTWTNNQKQDANTTPPSINAPPSINDATSRVPFSRSKTMNSHPKTITSQQTAAPRGTNHHMLPSRTPSKSPH